MFNRLRIYTVHLKPGDTTSIDQLRFVSEGFNFYAFVFNLFGISLWGLYNGMWRFTFLVALIYGVIYALLFQEMISIITFYVLQFGVRLWMGLVANDFLRAHLKRQGYITYALVSGENEIRAEQRFFDTNYRHLTT